MNAYRIPPSVIIFSKDRAMQLDALLDSLRENMAGDPMPPTPNVIWTASTPEFEEGYKRLFDTHASWCGFHRETNFNDDYLALLPKDGYVIHYVDDDIQHGRVNLDHAVRELQEDEDLVCVSLRLGLNTTFCYPLDQPQRMPADAYVNHHGLMTWRWAGGEHDMGYAFSLDAHLLRCSDVHDMLHASVFHNPNELEQTLASRAWMRSSMRPKMASYARSVVTGVPANLVNSTHKNRHGAEWAAERMNAMYLAGVRIDWRAMDWAEVDAAHALIPFAFTAPIAKAA